MALSFSERGELEHREGLVVRFYPNESDPWIANFIGGETSCSTVLNHPNETDVIVVAKGDVCIVNPEQRAIQQRIAHGDIKRVISLQALGLVVFQGQVDFTAIRSDNSGWISPRISWDDFRNIDVRDTELFGEAYTPVQNAWVP